MLHHSSRGRTGPAAETDTIPQLPTEMSADRNRSPFKRPLRVSVKEPSPQRPQELHRQWTEDYLKDLRTNRPIRPGGARPLPRKEKENKIRDTAISSISERAASAFSMRGRVPDAHDDLPERSASALSQRSPRASADSPNPPGRPIARLIAREVSTSTNHSARSSNSRSPSPQKYAIPYYERGQRWMERQEVSSLRFALEDKDAEDEKKLHEAAQNEASELVWKHQNPGAPYQNPQRPNYKDHLRKGSHARSQSIGPFETLYIAKAGSGGEGTRSASDGSNSNQSGRTVSDGSTQSYGSASSKGSFSKRYSSISSSVRSKFFSRKGRDGTRNFSGASGGTVLRHPPPRIFEEPSDVVVTKQNGEEALALKPKPRNTSYSSHEMRDNFKKPSRSQTAPNAVTNTVSIVNIHKIPPSQSRNAEYRRNHASLTSTDANEKNGSPRTKDGLEIRSDDIRAATSMRLKDRSTNLPSPSVVSDRADRPIVSFDRDWKPREKTLKQEVSDSAPCVEINVSETSAPRKPIILFPGELGNSTKSDFSVPTISAPDALKILIAPEIPSISVSPNPSPNPPLSTVPIISVPPGTGSNRPLPRPSARPLPTQTHTKSAAHWSPASSFRSQAQCSACALPISGRIVSAATQRFHPACFTCYQCGELLECVAFYPEPDNFRHERLARIQARLNNTPIPIEQSHFSEADDGDDSLRFYCHLDFHEKFSPRCRSCKTPIEGEVILACGGEWHAGHFFCAECGDPFEKDTPFVEKDGFAWCVGCHTKRYSGKCAGCKKPVTDMVVNALGKEWHVGCFSCKECGGQFEDGRFFTRGDGEAPVCVRCEEMRLKA